MPVAGRTSTGGIAAGIVVGHIPARLGRWPDQINSLMVPMA